jgi:hypothetical protein
MDVYIAGYSIVVDATVTELDKDTVKVKGKYINEEGDPEGEAHIKCSKVLLIEVIE